LVGVISVALVSLGVTDQLHSKGEVSRGAADSCVTLIIIRRMRTQHLCFVCMTKEERYRHTVTQSSTFTRPSLLKMSPPPPLWQYQKDFLAFYKTTRCWCQSGTLQCISTIGWGRYNVHADERRATQK